MIIKRGNITLNVGTLSVDDNWVQSLSIYPNPAKDIINIKLNNYQNTSATLYDISGRLMFEKKLNSDISSIDVSNLNNGMYLLKINAENKTITKRVIKQ